MSRTMTGKTERVIAEQDGSGWLVMWPDGDVKWYSSRDAVLRAARLRLGDADYLVTEVEWRSAEVAS